MFWEGVSSIYDIMMFIYLNFQNSNKVTTIPTTQKHGKILTNSIIFECCLATTLGTNFHSKLNYAIKLLMLNNIYIYIIY